MNHLEYARLTPELLKIVEYIPGVEIWVRTTQFNALHLEDGDKMALDGFVMGVRNDKQ